MTTAVHPRRLFQQPLPKDWAGNATYSAFSTPWPAKPGPASKGVRSHPSAGTRPLNTAPGDPGRNSPVSLLNTRWHAGPFRTRRRQTRRRIATPALSTARISPGQRVVGVTGRT
jgi:hypothetical protein